MRSKPAAGLLRKRSIMSLMTTIATYLTLITQMSAKETCGTLLNCVPPLYSPMVNTLSTPSSGGDHPGNSGKIHALGKCM